MAVDTEIFPVAAIGGIVIMVAVPVMNGKKVQVGQIELSAALGTNPAMKLQGAFPIIVWRSLSCLHFTNNFIGFFLGLYHRLWGSGAKGW